jgi:hypothetical protein
MFRERASSKAYAGLLRASTVVFKAEFESVFELTNRVGLWGTLSLSQILVEGLPANAKLTSNLRFTHPRRDPLARFSHFRLR